MWKTHKKMILLTICLCLLPIVVGVVLWDQLPEMMATHFGGSNEADSWMSKPMAVLGLPLIMAALELVVVFRTDRDPKGENMDAKSKTLTLWLMPAVCWVGSFLTYTYSLGGRPRVDIICGLLLSLVLMALGNYMPKNDTNHSFGIRTRWTLEDPEVWRRTQRLGGILMIVCGLVMIPLALLAPIWTLLVPVVLSAVAPIVYSYFCYQRIHA